MDADTYTYDFDSRLTAAHIGTAARDGDSTYTYNYKGVRTSATIGGVTTTYLVDPNRPYARVLTDTTGADVVAYVYGDDLLNMKRPAPYKRAAGFGLRGQPARAKAPRLVAFISPRSLRAPR